jgi:hypothetical protein
VSQPSDAHFVTAVAGGMLDDAGEAALLTFESAAGPVNLLLPAAELPALLSVCVGLGGEALPNGGEAQHPTIPVADWRVGVTQGEDVVMALAPQAGGALAFHLSAEQAQALVTGLSRALAALGPGAKPARAAGPQH